MATRARKGGGSPASSPKPIKGALAQEGEGSQSDALMMVMQRLEAIQHEQMAQAKAMERMLKATTENMDRVQAEVHQELKAERIRSETAFDALAKQFQKLAEANPDDPITQGEILKQELRKVKKNMVEKKQRFSEELKNMTTGDITSHEPGPVSIGVNGHYVIIRPGVNRDIPAPFIEEWERRIRVKKWADKVAYAVEIRDDEGIPDANKVARILGSGAIWNENTGAV